MAKNNTTENKNFVWLLWKGTVFLAGLYVVINFSADFFGFGMLPFTWPAVLYIVVSWLVLRFGFKQKGW